MNAVTQLLSALGQGDPHAANRLLPLVYEERHKLNNNTERLRRRAVLWWKIAFGCASGDGCRFVERIVTTM
jgi:hypothetical protein